MRQTQRQIPPGGSFAGASHVLLGSDYPFDMGTLECARQVKALSIPQADRATILWKGAASLLGVAA